MKNLAMELGKLALELGCNSHVTLLHGFEATFFLALILSSNKMFQKPKQELKPAGYSGR